MESLRLLFVVFIVFFTAWVLGQYMRLVVYLLGIKYDWIFELCLIVGQLFFQYPFISHKNFDEQMDYFYNLLLISFFGALMLIPMLFINHYITEMSDTANILYLLVVVVLMVLEHMRRAKKLQVPIYLSYTWVLYRFLVFSWLTVI